MLMSLANVSFFAAGVSDYGVDEFSTTAFTNSSLHQPRLDYLEELLESLPLNQPDLEIVVGINPLPSTPKV